MPNIIKEIIPTSNKDYFWEINKFVSQSTIYKDDYLYDQVTGNTYFRINHSNWYLCPGHSQEGDVVNKDFSQTLEKVREIAIRSKK